MVDICVVKRMLSEKIQNIQWQIEVMYYAEYRSGVSGKWNHNNVLEFLNMCTIPLTTVVRKKCLKV